MTELEQLLAALSAQQLPNLPAPATPMSLGPITPPQTPQFQLNTPPDLPPQAPMPAPNNSFIQNYSGPPPTPPAPLSKAQRIFNAIGGFGAGFQGNGAQYLEQLQQPQRQYQRQNEQYQARRTEGIQIDERRRERQQEMQTRAAERAADREFDLFVRKSGITDQAAIEQLRYVHEAERDARRFALDQAEQQRRERVQAERDARLMARDFTKIGARAETALELGRYYSG